MSQASRTPLLMKTAGRIKLFQRNPGRSRISPSLLSAAHSRGVVGDASKRRTCCWTAVAACSTFFLPAVPEREFLRHLQRSQAKISVRFLRGFLKLVWLFIAGRAFRIFPEKWSDTRFELINCAWTLMVNRVFWGLRWIDI